jgi:hypothetical protein
MVHSPFFALAAFFERLLRDSPAASSSASAPASTPAPEEPLPFPMLPPAPLPLWLLLLRFWLELRALLDCDGAGAATGSTMPRLLRFVLLNITMKISVVINIARYKNAQKKTSQSKR